MKSLLALASEIERFLTARDWRYCFIGGIALQRWGQPRLTVDVDMTLLTGFGGEEQYVDAMLKVYRGRLPDTRLFALQNRVLLLQSAEGIGIDVSLGAIPFEIDVVERASRFDFLPELSLLTCSAEDLIVLKAFADREQDWVDITGILLRQQDQLDWAYVQRQLAPLCRLKDAPDIMTRLQQCRKDLP